MGVIRVIRLSGNHVSCRPANEVRAFRQRTGQLWFSYPATEIPFIGKYLSWRLSEFQFNAQLLSDRGSLLINVMEVKMNLFRNRIDEFTIILFPDHLASR